MLIRHHTSLRRGLATLTCAVALLTAATPVLAAPASAPAPTSSASSSAPQTVERPTAGNDNPGATLGQGIKQHDGDKKAVNGAAAATNPNWKPSGILGMDVSGWQPNVNWASEYSKGARFAYAKASEGTYYTSPEYSKQASGARSAGMYQGAYHFAIPSDSSGATQARYFVAHGGGWSADGRTMPGLLDIEYNPYTNAGNTCYNMSAAQLTSWISSFTETYKSLTGRYPAIYTASNWWSYCTGNTTKFNNMPLHLANYTGAPGAMPGGWTSQDIWQYTDSGPFAGDSNVYAGSAAQLKNLVTDKYYKPLGGKAPAGDPGYYTASSGLKVKLTGGIGSYWNRNRALYGEPANNESCTLVNGGCFQSFKNGYSIYWTPNTGTHAVKFSGAIGALWKKAGYEGNYGYPLNDERCGLVDGGCYQEFSNGYAIYWKPGGTGAHVVKRTGAIGALWKKTGYEANYGYPLNDERCGLVDGGCYQEFSNGYAIYWKPGGTGAHAIKRTGAIGAAFRNTGWENFYGYPVTEETCGLTGGGCYQGFSNGYHVYWTKNTGARAIYMPGEIGKQWVAAGSERTSYPTSERTKSGTTYTQKFTGGKVLTGKS